jgi:hypothetical protein
MTPTESSSKNSRRQVVIACCQAVMFALYPLLLAVRVRKGLPLSDENIFRAAVVAIVAAVALLWALRFARWGLMARATWLSAVLALFGFYLPAVNAARMIGWNVYLGHAGFSLAYALLSLAAATLIVRPWQSGPRDTVPLTMAFVVMFIASVFPVVQHEYRTDDERGLEAAKQIIEGASRRAAAPIPDVDRDIYYIVLDSFGRSDVLEEEYGQPLSPFQTYLKSRGMYVAERAQSNYAQTFLSLSSTLNMTYLDGLAGVMGPTGESRAPLQMLIRHNALMKHAKQSGYRVIAIGSDYMPTSTFEAADVCYCDRYGLREFEHAVAAMTPIAAFPPLERWTYRAHYRQVLHSFSAIEKASELPGKKFVFAHMLSPHPPFVLAPDGSFEPVVAGPVIFNDGDAFAGAPADYNAGYRRQVQFVTSRLQQIVDHLLSRPGPPPVIVIHGDHGPGSKLYWDDPQATNMRERLSIFAAYHFPGAEGDLYPTITPVNAARLLSNRYLGGALPLLPDRSYFSTWDQPFDMIPASFDTKPASTAAHTQ